MRSYRIPTEISTELKINKMLYLFDLLFMVGLLIFYQMTRSFVHSSLSVVYAIFLAAFGLFMIVRPTTNPQKRMYQAILFALIKRKDTYCSIDIEGGSKNGID